MYFKVRFIVNKYIHISGKYEPLHLIKVGNGQNVGSGEMLSSNINQHFFYCVLKSIPGVIVF